MRRDNDFGRLVARLRARRTTLVLYPAALVGATIVYLLISPVKYRAEARFITNRITQPALSGLAAQLGILNAGEATKSPEFYQELVQSRDVLAFVAGSSYVVDGRSSPTSLIALWNKDQVDTVRAKERTFSRLRHDLFAVGSLRTGIITIAFESSDPILASQVARHFLDAVVRFDLTIRQAQGAREKRFLEGRLAVLRAELRDAEDRLQRFLLTNRSTTNSPVLAFERDRLQREVADRQTIVTAITQSFEQARIEEVRDTPSMSVTQAPENATTRVRSWPLALLSALVLGLIAASVDFFVRERLAEDGR